MGTNVFINNREVCCKASKGKENVILKYEDE